MPHNKRRHNKTIRTTLGDLAAAFYDAAFAELKNEAAAARVAQTMMQDAVRSRRVLLA